jgi:choline monooxygenase
MPRSLAEIIESYRPDLPLSHAWTIPAAWYVDDRVLDLERRTTFTRSWQCVARVDQMAQRGAYVACESASGEPIVVVRGDDGVLRAFFNVCRHHAAAVVGDGEGTAKHLRCPYHGWTYALDGSLKGTPDFGGVCDFDRAAHGLVPLDVAVWESWVFARLEPAGPSLEEFIGDELACGIQLRDLGSLRWVERRQYVVECNWKVYVDNYLDGGYHVPYLHAGLASVLDAREYTVETGNRFCLQRSPIVAGEGADATTGAVRAGEAFYYWLYPNFMINCYAGTMDTNLVRPLGVDRTEVVFDFYFADTSDEAVSRNRASIGVSDTIQREDEAICRAVQRGLASRAYAAGRLSVRREAGEHLFHRLLCADLKAGLVDW